MVDTRVQVTDLDPLERPIARSSAQSVAALATERIKSLAFNGEIRHLLVLTFCGTQARLWQIQNADDRDAWVRAIVVRDRAEAVAVVVASAVPPGVDGDACFTIAAEIGRGKHDNVLVLKRSPQGLMHRIGGTPYPRNERHTWLGWQPAAAVRRRLDEIMSRTPPAAEG